MAATTTTTKEHNRELDELYAAVGMALSSWNGTEIQFAQLFRTALGASDFMMAFDAYVAVVNFNARLMMTHKIVVRGLREARKKKVDTTNMSRLWSEAFSEASSLSDLRNKIAHRMAVTVTGPPDSEGNRTSVGVRLVDFVREQAAKQPPTLKNGHLIALRSGISLADVRKAHEDFHALGYKVFTIQQEWMRLITHPEIFS